MKEIDVDDFRVKPDDKVDLKQWPTLIDPVYKSKENYGQQLADHVARLSELQRKLYARIVFPCSSSSRPWTPPARTGSSAT